MPPKKQRGRGAKASRSSVSGKSKPKARARAKPKLKVHAKRPPLARKPKRPVSTDGKVVLGELVVPSGQLAIFDVGLVGYLPRPALAPMIVEVHVPTAQLAVTGTRVGRGRFAACWDHVAIALGDGEIVTSKKLGEAAIDFGRVMMMDLAALEHWRHEDSLDGLADVALSGRDAAKLAGVLGASRIGWRDLPLAEAEAKADLATKYKSENKWLVQIEVRPHSHDFQLRSSVRHGVSTMELAGTQLLQFATSWGDGVFPVYLDRDEAGCPVQVRIQLAEATRVILAA